MNFKEAEKKCNKYICPTYGKRRLLIVSGKGCYVKDSTGKEYLDFLSGIAVVSLGHSDKDIIKSIKEQAEKLIHTSNLYYTIPQIQVAEILSKLYGNGKVFFCNSGAEANEAAFKLARKYFYSRGKKKSEFIVFKESFHGRTLATIAATGQPKYQKSFVPLPKNFKFAEFNNLNSVKSLITSKTAAVMIELIQCEGGVNIAKKEFIKSLARLCKQKNILLIIDEVQTGSGRTGKFFAFQHYGIKPDIVTLAKGIAGGVPMGVMVADRKTADSFAPGDHASTFGGGPLICAASLSVLKRITNKNFLRDVRDKSKFLTDNIKKLNSLNGLIKEVRSLGLMTGIELNKEIGNNIQLQCEKNGLLINAIKNRILRIAPPLTVNRTEIKKGINIIKKSILELR